MNFKKIFTAKNISALFVFLLSLFFYVLTANRNNSGYADSDELITNAYLKSLAHPSGYPLSIYLARLFIFLPIPGSVAFRANLSNSFISALTVLTIFLTCLEIFKSKTDTKNKFDIYLASIISSLMLAFSTIFWIYATVLEVAPLNCLLASLTVLFSQLWKNAILEKQKDKKWLILTLVFVSLGISHHHTFLLIGPYLLFIFIQTLKKTKEILLYLKNNLLISVITLSLSFIIPLFLIFTLNQGKANVSWFIEPTIKAVWEHFARKAYSGFYIEKNVQAGTYLGNFTPEQYIKAFPYYFVFLNEHFTMVGLICIFLGLYFLNKNYKQNLYQILTLTIFTGLIFTMRLGIPSDPKSLLFITEIGVIQRQYLLGETFLPLIMVFGIYFIFQKINQKLIKIISSILVILILIISNFGTANQKNNTFAHDYPYEVLGNLEKNSVVICSADFACFSLFYVQEVEGFRKDVRVFPKNNFFKKYFADRNPEYSGFRYKDDPFLLADLISTNIAKGRNVYLTDLIEFYIDYIGFRGDPYYLIPENYLLKVTTKVPEKINPPNYALTQKILKYNFSSKDYYLSGLQDYFANYHSVSGTLFGYLGYKNYASENFNLALDLTNTSYQKARDLLEALKNFNGLENFKPNSESSSSAQFLQIANELEKKGELNEAYKMYHKASFLEPENTNIRFILANLYKNSGYFDNAKKEYEIILQLDPENKEAKEELEKLQAN